MRSAATREPSPRPCVVLENHRDPSAQGGDLTMRDAETNRETQDDRPAAIDLSSAAGEAGYSDAVPVAGPSARFGRNLAVVIGIDAYRNDIATLCSAVADARAIAEVLQRDHGFETWCLFDDEARRARLLTLLRETLPAALDADDRLLFYFAGHGVALDSDKGPDGYLLPADAHRSDPSSLLAMQVLHAALAELPVRHAFVILDCCFAGTFRWVHQRDVSVAGTRIYRERYDRYLESPAWQVLTSASSDQRALDMLVNARGEGGDAHSPFALALLDALAGAADYTQDHIIIAEELAIYVRDRVAPAAESAGTRQTPQLFPLERHDGGQFVFQVPNRPLALARAPVLDSASSSRRSPRAR
ncbi:MAG: caspase family protein [Deltaproteobacteria bacterium]|nr:MAG: caspase family protein [Deltaproteobacteria bacterium]